MNKFILFLFGFFGLISLNTSLAGPPTAVSSPTSLSCNLPYPSRVSYVTTTTLSGVGKYCCANPGGPFKAEHLYSGAANLASCSSGKPLRLDLRTGKGDWPVSVYFCVTCPTGLSAYQQSSYSLSIGCK